MSKINFERLNEFKLASIETIKETVINTYINNIDEKLYLLNDPNITEETILSTSKWVIDFYEKLIILNKNALPSSDESEHYKETKLNEFIELLFKTLSFIKFCIDSHIEDVKFEIKHHDCFNNSIFETNKQINLLRLKNSLTNSLINLIKVLNQGKNTVLKWIF